MRLPTAGSHAGRHREDLSPVSSEVLPIAVSCISTTGQFGVFYPTEERILGMVMGGLTLDTYLRMIARGRFGFRI